MPLHYLGAKVPSSNPLPRRPWRVRWQQFCNAVSAAGNRTVTESTTVYQALSLAAAVLVLLTELFGAADVIDEIHPDRLHVGQLVVIACTPVVALHATSWAVTRTIRLLVDAATAAFRRMSGTTTAPRTFSVRGVGAFVAGFCGFVFELIVGGSPSVPFSIVAGLAALSADWFLARAIERHDKSVPDPTLEGWLRPFLFRRSWGPFGGLKSISPISDVLGLG